MSGWRAVRALGAGRGPKPEDRVDEIVDHCPEACGGWGRRFGAEQRPPAGRFGRHRVGGLPPIGVIMTEARTVSDPPNAPSRRPRPAASNAARDSPTSAN